MSLRKSLGVISELFSGRWQVPALLIATVMGGLAVYRLVPRSPKPDFEAVIADLTLLERSGQQAAAADAAANLLEVKPELPPQLRAALHERLADLLYAAERPKDQHNPANLAQLLEHAAAARELAQSVTPESALRDARAHEWLGHDDRALEGLRNALQAGLPGDCQREAVCELVKLYERNPQARQERQGALDQLLTDTTLPLPYVWWGLRMGVQTALDANDIQQARRLLTDYGDRFNHSDLTGYLEHLRAAIALRAGKPEEAEPAVHWVDDWLGQEGRATGELDGLGFLPALNRVLLGEVLIALQQPDAALTAFAEALEIQPDPEVRLAAGLGQARAHALLSEHRAARNALSTALRKLVSLRAQFQRAVALYQRALLNLFDDRRAANDVPNAVAYLGLAGALEPDEVERTSTISGLPLWDLTGDDEKDPLAWENLQLARHFVRADEPRLAWLLYSAAEAYNEAGRPEYVRRTLEYFVQGRNEDARLPLALLRLGQACEASGDVQQGLKWYRRVMADYPRLGEASKAKLLSAGALVSLGEEHYVAAEQLLTELLVDGAVAPDGTLYREALLGLCELLYHEGRYADTISRLEDFLQLYPHDAERFRAQFTLADAYRRSSYVLRDQAPAGSGAGPAEATARQRFRAAAERFEQLLNDLETAAGNDEALQVYARLAALYRGDCLFELAEPDDLLAALAAYRSAASRYDGQPTALTARVQIANVLLRLGDVAEAARAIEGARWLLRTVPPQTCTPFNGGEHDHWEQFLSTVSSADLFAAAFADSAGATRTVAEPGNPAYGRVAEARTGVNRAGPEER